MSSVVQHQPAAPPTAPRHADEVDLLLRYVHERDVLCPRCGYNLRNLTQPVCPECREALELKVGVPRLPLVALLIALVPGAFCAVAVGIFTVMCLLHGPPSPSRDAEVWLVVGFFTLSTAAAIAIAIANRWFTRMDLSRQAGIAAVVWLVHLGVFVVVLSSI